METTTGAPFDYSYVSKTIHPSVHQKDQLSRDELKNGLTAIQYWKTKVKNETDAIKYYQLYYPEYPDVLVKALVKRIGNIVQQLNDDPNRPDLQVYVNQSHVGVNKWDYKQELLDNGIKID